MCKAWLRKKSQPKWVVPTLATLTNERFSHEGWLFKPKWDGERHPCGAVAAIIIANAMTLPRAARNEGTLVLKKFGDAQQVPKPPAPEPCVPPGNVPPLPLPDIPVPDPAPPPLENPGDVPLPPVTDPDVCEPGEPNPTHPPMRARGAKKVAASQEKSSQCYLDICGCRQRKIFRSGAVILSAIRSTSQPSTMRRLALCLPCWRASFRAGRFLAGNMWP
jgi:hypothetical protein